MSTSAVGDGSVDEGGSSSKIVPRSGNSCLSCRKAKAKCDRNKPCSRCVSRSLSCEYSEEPDGRRQHGALKRRLEELEYETSVLKDTIEAIRHADTADGISRVVSLIRSHASLPEIQKYLDEQVSRSESGDPTRSLDFEEISSQVPRVSKKHSAGSESASTIKHPKDRSGILRIARLVDDPPIKVPAQPWTQVTDDDHLVSHLVSLWFTWGAMLGYTIHEDLFVRDMQSGEAETVYCSRFLVNCMLAGGCFYSTYDETKTKAGAVSQICLDFFAEARRHLLDWDGQPSITMLQGLSVLYCVASLINQDRLGFEYVSRGIGVCNALMADEDAKVSSGSKDSTKEAYDMVRGLSAWGFFNISTASHLFWKKPQTLHPPSQIWRDEFSTRPVVKNEWINYPGSKRTTDSNRTDIFWQFCNLELLACDLTHIMFDDDVSQTQDKSMNLMSTYHSLQEWHLHLTEKLLPKIGSSPDLFFMHIWYHTCILLLIEEMQKELVGRTSADPLIEEVVHGGLSCVSRIVELLRLFETSWGVDKLHIKVVPALLHSLYRISADDKSSDYDAEFVDLCIYLRATGQRYPVSVSLLRMFQLDMQKQGKKLPERAERLFADFEDNDLESFDPFEVESLIPVPRLLSRPATGKTNETDPDTMTDFLRLAERLDIDDD